VPRQTTESVRYYSEAEHPFGPPRDPDYEEIDGVVYQKRRDTRMWVSVEWAADHGFAVPPNWKEAR